MRDQKLARSIVVGLFVIICSGSLHAQTTPSDLMTICAIAARPDRFEGQSVTVRARVFSDGEHGSFIYDESCEQYGVHLFLAFGAKGEDQLDAALHWCHRSTRGKLILGTFTGVFQFKPVFIGDSARLQIRVSRIDNLVLKSTKETSAAYPAPCPDAPPLDSLVHHPDN